MKCSGREQRTRLGLEGGSSVGVVGSPQAELGGGQQCRGSGQPKLKQEHDLVGPHNCSEILHAFACLGFLDILLSIY